MKPSLDSTTGTMSSTISADDSANQAETPQAHRQPTATTVTRSSDQTPRSTRCEFIIIIFLSVLRRAYNIIAI